MVRLKRKNGNVKHSVSFDGNAGTPFSRKENSYEAKKHRYLISDITDGGTGLTWDKEYHNWLTEKSNRIGSDEIAMLNARPAMRMLAKIALTTAGKSRHVKFFSVETEAVSWLMEGTEDVKALY